MIEIRNLRKEYEGVTPIKDISTTINDGDIVAIIGPSGTGKSTLLRCINLLEKPTSGTVVIDGHEITAKDADVYAIRQKMGMVFQSFNLFEHLSVIENIMSAPVKKLKMSKQEAFDKGMELLAMVGLRDKAFVYPDTLSGGQKQRVAIARALAMNPGILLMDEPTSALDPTMVGEVLWAIKNLAASGITMLIVTHEMNFAKNVATRIFYMDQGEIYEEGTPEEIFNHPKRELTRCFIEQIKEYKKSFRVKEFDFYGMLTELNLFCHRSMISNKLYMRLSLVLEELLLGAICKKYADIDFEITLTVSCKENEYLDLVIEYGQEMYDPLTGTHDPDEEISEMIVKKLSDEYSYSFHEGNSINVKWNLEVV